MISVIGGSGFIGTRFCQNLADRQDAFEIIDLKESQRFPEKTKVVDIRDLDALNSAITGEVIVNLAAVHRDDVRDKSEYYSTNVDGTRNICIVAEKKGINSIIFTSTVAVYGFAKPDTAEDGEINPFNDYGRSKFHGEEVLKAWQNKNKLQRTLTIIRPTVVFGEGNRGNVYNLLQQINSGRFLMVGDGTNRKSMAYVGNIAAFVEACVKHGDGYQLFNYVDKPDFDMNTLVRRVRHQLKKKNNVGLRIPYWLGMLLGYFADASAWLTGANLPISSIRVKKFCSTTVFDTSKYALNCFSAPYDLADALQKTVDAEFINPEPNHELFYTE